MTRHGAKWADVPAGAVAASVADMELAPPVVVLDAARDALRRGPGYPAPDEVARLVEAGAAWSATHHGLDLAPSRCLPVGSVAAAIAFVLARTTAPGDGVVRLTPGYPPITDAVRSLGRRDLAVDLAGGPAAGWTLDLDALDAACADATTLVWVAPHNPTGRVWREDEVAAVAHLAARHDLDVVADEVWADVVLTDRSHVPFARVAGAVDEAVAARTVTFVTTTKPWNLAGLGCGLLHAGSDELVTTLRGTGHVPMVPTPGVVALATATAAWEQGGPWLRETLDHLREVVGDAVATLRASHGDDRVTVPEGTYTLWLDLRGLAPDDDPVAALAVPDGVVPTAGATYGSPGFVRLNLATTADEAAEIVRRVRRLVPTEA